MLRQMPAFYNLGVHEALRTCGTPHYFTDYSASHVSKTFTMQLSILFILFLSYMSQTMGIALYLLYTKPMYNLRTCYSAFNVILLTTFPQAT